MRFIPVLMLLLCLAACRTTPQLPEPIGLAYLANKPLHLNVSRVEVVKQYQSSSTPPHVENDFPLPPVAMIQQWTQDRLFPCGRAGHAVVTIEDASVVEECRRNQLDRYLARVSVKIEIFDGAGQLKGVARAHAQSSQTAANNLTFGQRRKLWIYMMENLMNNFDQELERAIKSHLSAYLLDEPVQ